MAVASRFRYKNSVWFFILEQPKNQYMAVQVIELFNYLRSSFLEKQTFFVTLLKKIYFLNITMFNGRERMLTYLGCIVHSKHRIVFSDGQI